MFHNGTVKKKYTDIIVEDGKARWEWFNDWYWKEIH